MPGGRRVHILGGRHDGSINARPTLARDGSGSTHPQDRILRLCTLLSFQRPRRLGDGTRRR
jgi:hypothetical protein